MSKITRKFIFDMVCCKPMFKACAELELSDVGLYRVFTCHLRSLRHYDEPETLYYAMPPISPTCSDAIQS